MTGLVVVICSHAGSDYLRLLSQEPRIELWLCLDCNRLWDQSSLDVGSDPIPPVVYR